MAVTKILAKTMRLDKLINYVINADKTEEQALVSCIGCEAHTAAKTMIATKKKHEKTDGVAAYHIIQSFKPDEITPELAHELGNRFAAEYLDGYEVVVGTHIDKDHIHNHIAFNSVSDATGLKYHSSPESYYQGIRALSDKLCREYGLSIIMETGGKGLSYAEWKMRQAGLYTYKDLLEQDVSEALLLALDIGNFYELMEAKGYTIQHHSKYPSFIPYGSEKPFRVKLGGKSLSEDDIRMAIERGLSDPQAEIVIPRQQKAFLPYGKQKGFRALYVSWMYVLGIIGKGKKTGGGRISYAEVKRFEQYKRQADFLEAYSIDTDEQLQKLKAALCAHLDALTKQRITLNSTKKRRRPLYDALAAWEYLSDTPALYEKGASGIEDDYKKYLKAKSLLADTDITALKKEKTALYGELSEINAKMRNIRSELRLCESIENELPKIEDTLSEQEQTITERDNTR